MNKAIILENGFERDIPEELIGYLDNRKISWQHYDMREKFWPTNRAETIDFFSSLPEGQLLVCHTVFEDFQQLELMIELLYKLKHKKFTLKIMHGCLAEDLLKFYEEKESSITPRELEEELEGDLSDKQVNLAYQKIYKFKKEINTKFLEVLSSHNIYWIKWKEILLKNLNDIKSACK